MANYITNAAPMVIDYGTQDLSTRPVPREPEVIPQHLPKLFIFAQKGDSQPHLVTGAERALMYGSETFNPRSKYFNHSTLFANEVNAQGNSCMLQRLIPEDAGPKANIRLWMDVLETTVDLYERNSDGSLKLDALGDLIVIGTTPGYRVKFVADYAEDHSQAQEYGALTVLTGDQVDTTTGAVSQRYPIMEQRVPSQGSDGNLTGFRLYAPTLTSSNSMPTKLMSIQKVYPYFYSVIRRNDEYASPKIVESIFGEQKIMFSFKQGAYDPLTEKELYAGDVLVEAYQNLTDPRYAPKHGEFGEVHIYDANIDELLTKFHEAESPFTTSTSDFSDDPAERHLFNFISGVDSSNAPYNSFIFTDNVDSIRLSEYTNVFAGGGSDGTMSDAVHAALVKSEMQRYLNPDDEVQELAYHVESIFYDTGFPLDTKFELINAIALRKDTFVCLGTHEVGERTLTASEEHSIAIALRTRLRNFPESDYFGTPVMRGMIVGRSAKLRNSQFTKRIPMTLEVAIKAARYMGAGNGRWKSGSHFDGAPGSIVSNMYDINITWVPASVRNRNWDVGLMWVQKYDRSSYFFPALKTVYEDDTSVLNSFFTAMAICQLNKVAHAAWREFSGVAHLSNPQLIAAVNDFVTARTLNRFDDRFVIQPDTMITEMDEARGFSWTLPIKIYAPNMKTVMTTYVQSFRISDLEE